MALTIDDIKAVAKDGADLSAIEAGLSGMGNPLESVTDKDGAWSLIKETPILMQTFDKVIGERLVDNKQKLMDTEVKDLIKAREEELRRELNPKETEAQKIAREFEEYKKQQENKENLNVLRDSLAEKAKELEFDSQKARDYSVYGDKAVEKLEADVAWFNSQVQARVDAITKGKYTGNTPQKPQIDPKTIDQKIMEARANGNSGEALRLQMLKDKQQ